MFYRARHDHQGPPPAPMINPILQPVFAPSRLMPACARSATPNAPLSSAPTKAADRHQNGLHPCRGFNLTASADTGLMNGLIRDSFSGRTRQCVVRQKVTRADDPGFPPAPRLRAFEPNLQTSICRHRRQRLSPPTGGLAKSSVLVGRGHQFQTPRTLASGHQAQVVVRNCEAPQASSPYF